MPLSANTAHPKGWSDKFCQNAHGTELEGWWYPRGRELPKWSSGPPGRTTETPGEVKQVIQLHGDRSAVYSDIGVVSVAVPLRKLLLTAGWSGDRDFCAIDCMIQLRGTECDGVDACELCARGEDWQRGVFVGCFAVPSLLDNYYANMWCNTGLLKAELTWNWCIVLLR